jgi:hypothetical protein
MPKMATQRGVVAIIALVTATRQPQPEAGGDHGQDGDAAGRGSHNRAGDGDVESQRAIPALWPDYLKFRDAHFSPDPGARTGYSGGELWCQLNIYTIRARSVLVWQTPYVQCQIAERV